VPLRTIPPFNTKHDLTLRRILKSAISFYAGGDIRYYARQGRIAPSSDGGYVSPSYCLFSISAGCTFRRGSTKWDTRLRVDNLADNKYRPFESLVCGMGRNVKLMLSVSF
jgi:hypothetical protein